jgi:hypothetical protein
MITLTKELIKDLKEYFLSGIEDALAFYSNSANYGSLDVDANYKIETDSDVARDCGQQASSAQDFLRFVFYLDARENSEFSLAELQSILKRVKKGPVISKLEQEIELNVSIEKRTIKDKMKKTFS